MELTALADHPALWEAFPGGDLAAMPHAVLAELWTHSRLERADMARRIGREVAAALASRGVIP